MVRAAGVSLSPQPTSPHFLPRLFCPSYIFLHVNCPKLRAHTSKGCDTAGPNEKMPDRVAGAPAAADQQPASREPSSPGSCTPSSAPAGAWLRPVSAPLSRCRGHWLHPVQRPAERECWQDGKVGAAPGAAGKWRVKGDSVGQDDGVMDGGRGTLGSIQAALISLTFNSEGKSAHTAQHGR